MKKNKKPSSCRIDDTISRPKMLVSDVDLLTSCRQKALNIT